MIHTDGTFKVYNESPQLRESGKPVLRTETDGAGNQKVTLPQAATKVTVAGETTYVASANPGTAQSSALWQVSRVVESGGTTTITWADGNTNFDNVATDLTALAYS